MNNYEKRKSCQPNNTKNRYRPANRSNKFLASARLDLIGSVRQSCINHFPRTVRELEAVADVSKRWFAELLGEV